MNKWIMLVLGACLQALVPVPGLLTADEIMQRVNDREDGDNIVMEMQMVLINKNNEQRATHAAISAGQGRGLPERDLF